MTKPKTKLSDLTKRSLNNRITSAEWRVYDLKEELDRREKIARYGTETPELREFNIAAMAEFSTRVQAKDEADAIRVFENSGWLDWDDTQPGGAVVVEGYWLTHHAPLAVEAVEMIRADAAKRLKKIEASRKIVGVDGGRSEPRDRCR